MRVLILLSLVFAMFFVSCSTEAINSNKEKRACLQEGIYCKGETIYSCKNNDNNEAIETLVKVCQDGDICSNGECVVNDCDEVINCIKGEKKCVDERSYKVCGNYDSDICFEWESSNCDENFHCDSGECVKDNIKNPCTDYICGDFSHCQAADDMPSCVCNDGYHKENENCVPDCVPRTCIDANIECGSISDNCGSILECGTCSADQVCNDNGICDANCDVKSCSDLNVECGSASNGCGDILECGTCPSNQECQDTGLCEDICIPVTCEDLARECGDADNACGRSLICGTCEVNQTCNDNGICIDDVITCDSGTHEENGFCVNNQKTVSCIAGDIPQNSSHIRENVTITWTEESGWPSAPQCSWECNFDFHVEETSCVSDIKSVSCNSNNNAPVNADTIDAEVTVYWDSSSGWSSPAQCLWECPADRHLDTDSTICILTDNNDYCDGLDNNHDGIIDNCYFNTNDVMICNQVAESACPSDCFAKTYNNHIYYFCSGDYKSTWSDSEDICTDVNLHLVSINNQAENDFISSNIAETYWIGYYQNNGLNSASWYWSDNSSKDFENWANNEPSNSWHDLRRENCTEIYSNGEWNDADCNASRAIICEDTVSDN